MLGKTQEFCDWPEYKYFRLYWVLGWLSIAATFVSVIFRFGEQEECFLYSPPPKILGTLVGRKVATLSWFISSN